MKSLLQLRCVCKSWNSLISDPKFVKKHLRCSTKDSTRHHILLHHLLNTTWTLISWLNLIFHGNVVLMAYPLQSVFNTAVAAPTTLQLDEQFLINFIVGSCDGILCLDIYQSSPLLWNPSTRSFKKLPSLENLPLEEEEYYMCYTRYGFGYDHFLPVTEELVWGLGVMRDSLCVISYPDGFAHIWLMKEYGNKDSWTKLFSMKMMEELDLYPNLLHISEDGEVLLLQLKEKLVLYNSRDATFKTTQILDLNSWMSSVIYVESLISP